MIWFSPWNPRRHADDAVSQIVDLNGATGNLRIAAEQTHPETIADHGHGRGARARVLLRPEAPAHHGFHTQSREVIAGDDLAHEQLRIAPAGQVHGDRRVKEQGREDGVVVAVVLVIRIGTKQKPGVARVRGKHSRQGGRFPHRQGTQKDRVQQGENGGVRADSQRERHDGYQCEAAVFRQRSKAVAQIVQGSGIC